MMSDAPHRDQRTGKDRRLKPTSPLSLSSLLGSRNTIRRAEDREKHFYVDRYSLRSVVTVFFTILLSVLDAILTFKLVNMGVAIEANPVMNFFLQFGWLPFLGAKYILTGSCLMWCLVHKNYSVWGGKFTVKGVIVAVLLLYMLLILYELVLFI